MLTPPLPPPPHSLHRCTASHVADALRGHADSFGVPPAPATAAPAIYTYMGGSSPKIRGFNSALGAVMVIGVGTLVFILVVVLVVYLVRRA